MMYKCNDCGREFEEPVITESSASGMIYKNCTNPRCQSEDIEELHHCPVCSAWIKSSQDYCNNCYAYVEEMLNDLSNKLETTDEHIEQMITNVKGW